MLRKTIGLLMSLVLLFSFSLNSFALATEEPEIQPYYSYTSKVKTSLSFSGEKAMCSANLTGKSGTTTKVKITMTLEKKVLFWWSEKQTWTQTFNSYSGTLAKTYSDANSGTKSETITDTSAEVKV